MIMDEIADIVGTEERLQALEQASRFLKGRLAQLELDYQLVELTTALDDKEKALTLAGVLKSAEDSKSRYDEVSRRLESARNGAMGR